MHGASITIGVILKKLIAAGYLYNYMNGWALTEKAKEELDKLMVGQVSIDFSQDELR